MGLAAEARECDCRGNPRERHTVQVLFRGAGGSVTWDAVPADAAHEIVAKVARLSPHTGYRDTMGHPVASDPLVVNRPSGYAAPAQPGGSQVVVPAAVIVVVPGEVQAVQLR